MGSTKTQKEISREGLESYYDLEEEEEEEEEGRKHAKPVHVDRRDLPEMDVDMQAKLDAPEGSDARGWSRGFFF